MSNGSIGRDRVEHVVADHIAVGIDGGGQEGDRPSLAMKPFDSAGRLIRNGEVRQHGVLAIEGVKFVRRQYDKGRVVQRPPGKAISGVRRASRSASADFFAASGGGQPAHQGATDEKRYGNRQSAP